MTVVQRRMIVTFCTAVSLAATATPAAAARSAGCVGDLASTVRSGMTQVTTDWRNDFRGLDQAPGLYAAHIAPMRGTDCPPLP